MLKPSFQHLAAVARKKHLQLPIVRPLEHGPSFVPKLLSSLNIQIALVPKSGIVKQSRDSCLSFIIYIKCIAYFVFQNPCSSSLVVEDPLVFLEEITARALDGCLMVVMDPLRFCELVQRY